MRMLLAGTATDGWLVSIVESAMDAIITVDEKQRIVLFNPAAEQMFRCQADDVLGQPIDGLIPERFRTEHREQMHRFGDSGVTRRVMGRLGEIRGLRANGEEFPAEASISHVQMGEKRLFTVIIRDITERKLTEEALHAAKTAAEEANAAKDRFLAVLSHELRTPLTPVLAAASMLADDVQLPKRFLDDIETIRRNVDLEARLIDDLLDVTRIIRGKLELQRKPVLLAEITQRAREICGPDAEAKGLYFGIDMDNATSCMVMADAVRLQQVFWNLLKNSIKFTPPGGCVGLRCRHAVDVEGDHVIVEVNDSGMGIEPDVLPDLFKPFVQGNTSRQFGGLGLGLTICKALVEMHNGRITAHSEGIGKGATFRVRLPLSLAPRAATADDTPRHTPGPPLRVLLVEDHADTAWTISRALSAHGHKVETARNVATALRLARQQTFDVLLSDLGLPDGSGLDVMRTLRKNGSMIPGVLFSGYGQEQDIRGSLQAGFGIHLVKPITIRQLEDAMETVRYKAVSDPQRE